MGFISNIFSINKYKLEIKIWLIIPFLVSITLLILNFSYRYFEVNVLYNNNLSVYSDKEINGNSTGFLKLEEKGFKFSYTILKGFQYPYVGIHINLSDKIINKISSNDFLKIKISATKSTEIPIIFNEFVNFKNDTLNRIWQYNIKLKSGMNTYLLKISDFKVPTWWYLNNKKRESDFHALDLNNVRGVCIQNCIFIQENQEDTIKVEEIIFTKDFNIWWYNYLIFTFFWYIFGGLYFLWKTKRSKSVYIPYVVTNIIEQPEDDWRKLQSYISENYMNNINLDGIQKELGISKHRISSLIKEQTSLIFKQYLNQIRIAEAKRLLQETNLPINEISDNVGYGNLSNFNRVFKEYTGNPPSFYRN